MSSQKVKSHHSLQAKADRFLLSGTRLSGSDTETYQLVLSWLALHLAHTQTANTNTYCTPLTCLSWDRATALLEHLNTNTNVGLLGFTDAHTHTHTRTHTHTEPSARCISCVQMPRSDRASAIIAGHRECVSSWVHEGAQIILTS